MEYEEGDRFAWMRVAPLSSDIQISGTGIIGTGRPRIARPPSGFAKLTIAVLSRARRVVPEQQRSAGR